MEPLRTLPRARLGALRSDARPDGGAAARNIVRCEWRGALTCDEAPNGGAGSAPPVFASRRLSGAAARAAPATAIRLGAAGFELPEFSSGNTWGDEIGGSNSGSNPELAAVVRDWARLPDHVRAAILALVRGAVP